MDAATPPSHPDEDAGEAVVTPVIQDELGDVEETAFLDDGPVEELAADEPGDVEEAVETTVHEIPTGSQADTVLPMFIHRIFRSLPLRSDTAPAWEEYTEVLQKQGLSEEITPAMLAQTFADALEDPTFADHEMVTALAAIIIGYELTSAKTQVSSRLEDSDFIWDFKAVYFNSLPYVPPAPKKLALDIAGVTSRLIENANSLFFDAQEILEEESLEPESLDEVESTDPPAAPPPSPRPSRGQPPAAPTEVKSRQGRTGRGSHPSVLPTDRWGKVDPVKLYLKEIGKVPLLISDEEVKLAKAIERGLLAEYYLFPEDQRADSLLSTAEIKLGERAERYQWVLAHEEDEDHLSDVKNMTTGLLKRQARKGKEAEGHLIKANTRLVVSIAKKYQGRGLPILDLIQEGNLGLMRAVEKFDWRRGLKFSTYATWWIRQAITRGIADQARTIRVPVHAIEKLNKINRARRELEQSLEREPTLEELAQEVEWDEDTLRKFLRETTPPMHLDSPFNLDDDLTLGDVVEDRTTESRFDDALNEMRAAAVREALEGLSDREAEIIRLRFGLIDGRPRTLEEVGKEFGVTRERIRQIESKALGFLRHPLRRERLQDFMT